MGSKEDVSVGLGWPLGLILILGLGLSKQGGRGTSKALYVRLDVSSTSSFGLIGQGQSLAEYVHDVDVGHLRKSVVDHVLLGKFVEVGNDQGTEGVWMPLQGLQLGVDGVIDEECRLHVTLTQVAIVLRGDGSVSLRLYRGWVERITRNDRFLGLSLDERSDESPLFSEVVGDLLQNSFLQVSDDRLLAAVAKLDSHVMEHKTLGLQLVEHLLEHLEVLRIEPILCRGVMGKAVDHSISGQPGLAYDSGHSGEGRPDFFMRFSQAPDFGSCFLVSGGSNVVVALGFVEQPLEGPDSRLEVIVGRHVISIHDPPHSSAIRSHKGLDDEGSLGEWSRRHWFAHHDGWRQLGSGILLLEGFRLGEVF